MTLPLKTALVASDTFSHVVLSTFLLFKVLISPETSSVTHFFRSLVFMLWMCVDFSRQLFHTAAGIIQTRQLSACSARLACFFQKKPQDTLLPTFSPPTSASWPIRCFPTAKVLGSPDRWNQFPEQQAITVKYFSPVLFLIKLCAYFFFPDP